MPLQATLLVLPLKSIKLLLSNGFFYSPFILTEIMVLYLPCKMMCFILKFLTQFSIYYVPTMCQVLSETLATGI